MMPPGKVPKLVHPPANVIIQFQSPDGGATGPQLDVPQSVTPTQLETLLNGLLQNDDKLPYSFFVEEQELGAELGEHLLKNKVSVEAVLRIVYQPQAVFRVRPVTRCTASIPGHAEAVLSVSFSPDGKRLASGSGDTTVRFWDLNTQTPEFTCKGHTNWVLVVAWSPDACIVASGGMDGNVLLWDPVSGKLLGTCKGHRKWITCLAWEPAHLEMPCKRFATGSKDCSIKVWDAQAKRCLYTTSNHTMAITALKWCGDGRLVSAARDCSINVWDAADGKLVRSLKGHGHWVNTLALSTECVLRTGPYDHHGHAPKGAEPAKQAALKRYQEATGGQPERLVSGSDDFTMFLWEPSTSKTPITRMTGHMQLINHVQFSPDGRWIASASFDKSVKLWDGVKGTFVATFRGHVGPVYQVAWSSDSRLVLSGSKDSTLKVWEVRTRKVLSELPGHADEVFSVDWAPTGDAVASGGKDRVLKLWKR